jgi:hypothetical protein
VDIGLHMRVLWRFRVLVLTGLVLALVLAFFSFFRISVADGRVKLSHRGKEQWASFSRVFVTRPGFEWGSSLGAAGPGASDRVTEQRMAEDRLTSLAIIYSNLTTGDPVERIMLRNGPLHGTVLAAPLPVQQGSDQLLPIISIEGLAGTRAASIALTLRATHALVEYIRSQQRASYIPAERRIVLDIVNRAGDTKLVAGRPKTLPIVVFMAVMLGVVGLAVILENLRPQVRPLPAAADAGNLSVVERRSRSAAG